MEGLWWLYSFCPIVKCKKHHRLVTWALSIWIEYLDFTIRYLFADTLQDFWRNYFYRVSLVKQSSQLNSLAKSGGNGEGSTDTSTAEGPQTPSDDGKGTYKF